VYMCIKLKVDITFRFLYIETNVKKVGKGTDGYRQHIT